MFQFKITARLLIAMVASLMMLGLSRADHVEKSFDYIKLKELLSPENRLTDFVALTDYEDGFEESVHQACLEYFENHPELVQRIRNDLGSRDVNWHLERLSHRLLFAPESRDEVAVFFSDYCRAAIEDLLARTGLVNPFSTITPLVDKALLVDTNQGVQAFIVHDLARQYVARYQFNGTDQKRIELDVSGRIVINETGSYTSYLHFSEKTHTWEFNRNRHTFWKSVSTNPYTVLMTPLEETLHIALRKHTEKGILESVVQNDVMPSLTEIQEVVDDWLAVEEAIVGGLVYELIPDIVLRRIPDLPMEWVRADLETKSRFEKYRLLRKGIAFVEAKGIKESIHLYAEDPAACRVMLKGPTS